MSGEREQFFASDAVLKVNFRGSGNRMCRKDVIDDIVDATRWAIDEGIDRICIFGGSYGGYAAMMGMIREPDLSVRRNSSRKRIFYDRESLAYRYMDTYVGEDKNKLKPYHTIKSKGKYSLLNCECPSNMAVVLHDRRGHGRCR